MLDTDTGVSGQGQMYLNWWSFYCLLVKINLSTTRIWGGGVWSCRANSIASCYFLYWDENVPQGRTDYCAINWLVMLVVKFGGYIGQSMTELEWNVACHAKCHDCEKIGRKITFLTPISRSKVRRSSIFYDMCGPWIARLFAVKITIYFDVW